MKEIKPLIDGYKQWIHDQTMINHLQDCVEITTPYFDRHNDRIQIYVSTTSDGYLLTDSGETIMDLAQSGYEWENPQEQIILNIIVNRWDVDYVKNALQVSATEDNFSFRMHALIQAILSVNAVAFWLPE
jgi:Domain of unknown function DUF1828